jgi:peptidyl-tRNA hydrolase
MLFQIAAFGTGILVAFAVHFLRHFRTQSTSKEIPSSVPGSAFQNRCTLPSPTQLPSTEPRFIAGIRTDIKLPHSKIASVMAQLVIDAVTSQLPEHAHYISEWYHFSQAKICTKVPSIEVMNELIAKATAVNVPFVTYSENGEILAIGVGPARIDVVDQVTRALKLL